MLVWHRKRKCCGEGLVGSLCPVSISRLTLEPLGVSCDSEPQTAQVPLPLAALWPPGVEGDWLRLQWLYHFTFSLLRVLEWLGPGGERKSVLGCEEKEQGEKPAPKLRPTGGFRQNLGEPQPRPFSL